METLDSCPAVVFFFFTLTIMTPSCSTEELLLQSKLHPHPPGILLLVVLSALLHVRTFDPLCQNTSVSWCSALTHRHTSVSTGLVAVITSTHSVPVKSAFPTAYTTGRAPENVSNICSSPETEESAIVSEKLSQARVTSSEWPLCHVIKVLVHPWWPTCQHFPAPCVYVSCVQAASAGVWLHKPAPGLSQLEHNLNSLHVSTRTQSRSLWEASTMVPLHSRLSWGRQERQRQEVTNTLWAPLTVPWRGHTLHSVSRESGIFLSLIKLLERQLEQYRELLCVMGCGCAKPTEKRIKFPAVLSHGAITSRLRWNLEWLGIMSTCQRTTVTITSLIVGMHGCIYDYNM